MCADASANCTEFGVEATELKEGGVDTDGTAWRSGCEAIASGVEADESEEGFDSEYCLDATDSSCEPTARRYPPAHTLLPTLTQPPSNVYSTPKKH